LSDFPFVLGAVRCRRHGVVRRASDRCRYALAFFARSVSSIGKMVRIVSMARSAVDETECGRACRRSTGGLSMTASMRVADPSPANHGARRRARLDALEGSERRPSVCTIMRMYEARRHRRGGRRCGKRVMEQAGRARRCAESTLRHLAAAAVPPGDFDRSAARTLSDTCCPRSRVDFAARFARHSMKAGTASPAVVLSTLWRPARLSRQQRRHERHVHALALAAWSCHQRRASGHGCPQLARYGRPLLQRLFATSRACATSFSTCSGRTMMIGSS